MLSVIATGGKQYVVKTGGKVKVEKLAGNVGDTITFDNVLLTAEEDASKVEVGTPNVSGAKVSAKILRQARAEKIYVEKFKRKVRYHKVHGHRQYFTELQIA